MKTETGPFNKMAPVFLQLGQELLKTGHDLVRELGEGLVETGECFATLADGKFANLGCYKPSQLEIIRENLQELTRIASAVSDPNRREDQLLIAVGEVADGLQISGECRRIRDELRRELLRFSPSRIIVSYHNGAVEKNGMFHFVMLKEAADL